MANRFLKCPGRLAPSLTRRQYLQQSANGFGAFALASMLAQQGQAAPSLGHYVAKVKSVIFCFMDGGVSHVDTFDPKPKLDELHLKPATNIQTAAIYKNRKWLKSPWSFRKHGESGTIVSDLFPHIATVVDDIAVIRSMQADLPIHSTGVLLLHTGHNTSGQPSMGAWASYGLGAENQNLPSFVVLSHGVVPCGGMETYSSGFLPASHEATTVLAKGRPIENLQPADKSPQMQRAKLNLLRGLDSEFAQQLGGDASIEAAIRNYELAFKLQSAVPDLLDLSRETEETVQLYGIDSETESKKLYGIQCLRARRMVEAGIRFIEITCPPGASNGTWDQHGNLKEGHEKNALDTDQAVAGLIKDLKQRGLLDETLVVWAGEFGRTPHAAGEDGRDHHPEGFSIWMAGGGVKGGTVLGTTDELGMYAVENVTTIHDMHATMLHLLGLDHELLTFRFGGRDMSLTDVHGRVITEILA